ncbi:MAG TPA: glycosyl hydrolase family 65 protein [Treponemataceae bacterium]|nr:glycosyl hydrolase family 65 protein [Treponemataceae bacterium]
MIFTIERSDFAPHTLPLEETLFHCANGYLGVRSNFEEGQPEGIRGIRGTYINAFHDTHPIHHPEKLYGFPEVGEKILNVTDVQTISVVVDGEPVNLNTLNTGSYNRVLDMQRGYSGRTALWTGETGKRIRIAARRLASFTTPELFALEYSVEALDPLTVRLGAEVRGAVSNFFDPADPRVSGSAFSPLVVESVDVTGSRILVSSRTGESALRLAVGVDHQCTHSGKADIALTGENTRDSAVLSCEVRLQPGEKITIVKKAVFCDSLRYENPEIAVHSLLDARLTENFESILATQETYLASFWDTAAISIEGDDDSLRGLLFNLYHLLQSAPRDQYSHIPAKGLSGEGYEGHYFWDTEIYMLPFFLYTNPELAKNLLEYRYTTLPEARDHARELGHSRGAAYPWRTITGRECSPYYPSGSAQYHINADIAWALWRYHEATGDEEFLFTRSAEILFETARIWMETGTFSGNKFRINTVTGPDEYTCLVNNNYYTNAMAQQNLRFAYQVHTLMENRKPEALNELSKKIALSPDEPETWNLAAETMLLPYDPEHDINPQDDSFLLKPVWDFANTPDSNYPLLLHYHPMTLSRFQVCKQADTILAYILLDSAEKESTIRNSYSLYEKITTHDSSLSYAAFSLMAARLGEAEKAYRYFNRTVSLDLDDIQKNTRDGIHAANMGGTWLATVQGFGGFRPINGVPAFTPCLPAAWQSLAYRVQFRNTVIAVLVRHDEILFEIVSGPALDIMVNGNGYHLKKHLHIHQGKEDRHEPSSSTV